jgi:hypothetical protein
VSKISFSVLNTSEDKPFVYQSESFTNKSLKGRSYDNAAYYFGGSSKNCKKYYGKKGKLQNFLDHRKSVEPNITSSLQVNCPPTAARGTVVTGTSAGILVGQ